MSSTLQIIAGIVAGVGLAVIDDVLINGPIGSMVTLGFGLVLLIIGVIRGQKMSLFLRALISMLILYWGFGTCLAGRTTEVGITRTTVGMAVTIFLMYGAIPGFALLRLWPFRRGIVLLCALFPASFALACLAGSMEEYLFVQKYKDTGVGPTARWTVPHHWLAYDKEHKRLDGSD